MEAGVGNTAVPINDDLDISRHSGSNLDKLIGHTNRTDTC